MPLSIRSTRAALMIPMAMASVTSPESFVITSYSIHYTKLYESIESFKNIGLKPEVRLDLFNGALKCKFNNYKLFSGKRNDRTTK